MYSLKYDFALIYSEYETILDFERFSKKLLHILSLSKLRINQAAETFEI